MLAPVRAARREPEARENATSKGTERDRIEAWIVHALADVSTDGAKSPSRSEPRLKPMARPNEPGAAGAWARLHVGRSGSVCLARLAVDSLLKPQVLEETTGELLALASSSSGRVLLNLASVERLASAFVAALAEVHRACSSRDGGGFRICGLRADHAPVLSLTGLDRVLEVFPDEAAALAHPWPRPSRAAVLPVELLRELAARPAQPTPESPHQLPAIRLRVLNGPSKGIFLAVPASGGLIGRAEGSAILCKCPSVSRRHASITPSPKGWVLNDLESSNGTFLNGRRVLDAELLLVGDILSLGKVKFAVFPAEQRATEVGSLDDMVAEWVSPPQEEHSTILDDSPSESEIPAQLPPGVRLMEPRVLDTDEPDAWRIRLDEAIEGDLRARLVINLERVGALNSRALGILVARAIELQRNGGGLRFAHPTAELRARLEWLRVSELVGLFPRVEDAILTSWE